MGLSNKAIALGDPVTMGGRAGISDSIYSYSIRILRPNPNCRGLYTRGVDPQFDREMSDLRKHLGNG